MSGFSIKEGYRRTVLKLNYRRLIEIFTDPNSPRGLAIRAEKLEEDAEKTDGRSREGMLMYARLLRELALKDWSPAKNKRWINENMRKGSMKT